MKFTEDTRVNFCFRLRSVIVQDDWPVFFPEILLFILMKYRY